MRDRPDRQVHRDVMRFQHHLPYHRLLVRSSKAMTKCGHEGLISTSGNDSEWGEPATPGQVERKAEESAGDYEVRPGIQSPLSGPRQLP